ncbi:MAG: hypothetical protein HZB40_05170 [Rhodocyclales bacterium]|nr:hypothetical protein [Rhodocyclales bacterium]
MRCTALLLWLAALHAFGKTCVECHEDGAKKSWALSKHGVIFQLEAGRERRRAPDCAGCHRVEATTPTVPHYGKKASREHAREAAQDSCRACHSPRYTTGQNAAAQRGIEIGLMKRREAAALLASARKETSGPELARIEALYVALEGNLRDLRLGLAHQSPDYQWWLGQAALDGSLLRIKGALGEARRTRALAASGK